MTEPIHIAVTGAAGRISYALLFRIAAGAMFGVDRPVALSLLEVPEAMPLLDATMMELDDCAFPLLRSVRASTDAAEAFADADWVILIGSAPYRLGMSRTEALRVNGPIFQADGRAINESAKNARVLVVANPCNTNCLIAQVTAHDVPPDHWFAMTRLDQNRARAMLAHKANVPVDHVTRVTVWGNHGPSVFADFHNAWIGDQPAHEVIHDRDWVRTVFEPGVAGRGQILYNARGASPAASVAQRSSGRSGASPRPRRTSIGSARPWSPTAATASRADSSSASRSAPKTVGLGRSSRAITSMTTPRAGSPRTSPRSNRRRWSSQNS